MISALLILILSPLGVLFGQTLEEYRWKNRLLLILNPTGPETSLHPQIEAFSNYSEEVAERDLLIFVLRDNNLTDMKGSEIQMAAENLPYSDYEGVVLIGKDGGVKLKEPFLVDPGKIFELIDSMPMRKAEIRSSEKY